MHPAPSLIVFTVLSGLGLGFLATIGLGLGGQGHLFGWVAGPLALMIAGLGGVASVAHLGRPDRAWRAFTQWRSSWLSREACLMMAAKVVFTLYLALWLLLDMRLWGLGLVAAALALATVYATAKIYHQLRTVPRWSGTPTPWLFLALALTGGLLANGTFAALTGTDSPVTELVLALVATAGIAVWWQTHAAGARRSMDGSTMESATGLGAIGRVRLLEPPHTGTNYLLQEMAFEVGRARAFQLRWLGAALGFLVPILLAFVSLALGPWVLGLALISHVLGVMALRWLFYAEAEHVQALYYGIR